MPNQLLQKYMQLTKVDVAKRLIYGVFTAEQPDKSGEVADYETTKAAFQAWSDEMLKVSAGKSKGNIRKMHGKEVVGKAVEIIFDDLNKVISGAVEVNQQTVDEAEKGYLNGFSIGGAYAKKWPCPVFKGKTRFTPVLAEVSVVDNPCVPDARFDAIKDASFQVITAAGATELRKFAPKADVEAVQMFKASDGSLYATREAAITESARLAAAAAAAPVLSVLEDVEKRAFSQAERDKAAASGAAMPDGSFPIHTTEDLHNAISLAGKAKDPAAAKAHIKTRAKALGAEHMLPDAWKMTLTDSLKKAMHHVAQLAHVVDSLSNLAQSHEREKGEGHPVTEKLKKHARGLADTMHAMAGDEACDMNDMHESYKAAGLTDEQISGIAKALEIAKTLEKFKDTGAQDPALQEALAKVTAERDALAKQLADLPAKVEKTMAAMQKRIADLEAQPMPDKVVLTTVHKGGEPDPNQDEDKKPVPFNLAGSTPDSFRKLFNR